MVSFLYLFLILHTRRKIKELKNEIVNSYLSELANGKSRNYSLWKATKRFKRPITQISQY